MNQITELLRLTPGASIQDAAARLSILFDLMSGAPGFRDAELLRKADEPDLLLVLHTWDNLETWSTFRRGDTKIAFSAGRPDFLYTFVPCGINWLALDGELSQEGDFVRRELIREPLEPRSGPGIICSQTFSYQDYEPSLEGVLLRLTRHRTFPSTSPAAGDTVIADEIYESVMKYALREAGAAIVEHAEIIR